MTQETWRGVSASRPRSEAVASSTMRSPHANAGGKRVVCVCRNKHEHRPLTKTREHIGVAWQKLPLVLPHPRPGAGSRLAKSCQALMAAPARAPPLKQGDFRVAGRLPHLHARGRVAGLRHETNAILRLKARRARVARVRATDYRAVKQRMDEVPGGRQCVALRALQRGRRCCGRWATTRCRSSSRLLLAQGDQPWWYECLPSASRSRCHRRGRRVQQRRRR